MRAFKALKTHLSLMFFIGFAFMFVFGLTLGPKLDYDVWFHLRAGEYFWQNGFAPTVAIDSWYAQAQNVYWVSHEWLFGAFVYWLMDVSPYLVNLLSTVMLSTLAALIAYYNRHLFRENPAIAFVGIMVLAMVLKIGNTPRPHLFAYFFTFLLFAILKKDMEKEGNTIYWLVPLTLAWVNMHGGSYALLFVFLLISIIIGCFDFQLGKIEFKKSSKTHQLKRIAVFIVSLALVSVNAHGLNMYLYPFSNMADNLMQGNITEWNAPNLKEGWQVYIYVTTALFFTSMIATNKKVKAIDLITGMAYMVLAYRSIRFAPQMAIIVLMIVGEYTDSLSFMNMFGKRLTLLFSTAMLAVSVISVIPSLSTYPSSTLFNLSKFPSDELIDGIKEIGVQKLYNPYDCGGYLTYKGLEVFIDGRADIYTSINLREALNLQRGNSKYLEYIKQYDFDYMLVNASSILDNYLTLSPDKFTMVLEDQNYKLFSVHLPE